MFNRSRWVSHPLLPLLLMLSLIAAGTTGCNRTKPREHFWQLWRPKSIKAEKSGAAYMPDMEMLPPAPGVLDPMESGSSSSLPSDMPPPPTMAEAGSISEPDPIRSEARPVSELHKIPFDYDSSELSADAQRLLNENAQWLLNRPNYEVSIEGHCDDRGTPEYNLNLGMRRAKMVRDYLISKGVDAGRLHTISYGEERPLPVSPGMAETQVWAQNRRAQFFVY
jgi:peptidoglycan-associated lipoprotein